MAAILAFFQTAAGRWSVIAALFFAAWGFGYVRGLERGHKQLDAYRASVEVQGAIQNTQTAATIKQQKQINQEAQHETLDLRARLAQHYAAVRVRQPAGAGQVPTIPRPAEGDAGAASEPGACPAGDATLTPRCAQDAQTILMLQRWVRDQKKAWPE